MESEALS